MIRRPGFEDKPIFNVGKLLFYVPLHLGARGVPIPCRLGYAGLKLRIKLAPVWQHKHQFILTNFTFLGKGYPPLSIRAEAAVRANKAATEIATLGRHLGRSIFIVDSHSTLNTDILVQQDHY
jgi:hypothetical protein